MKYTYKIEYWKAGLPHKIVYRYIDDLTTVLRSIGYIIMWYYRIEIYDAEDNLVWDYTAE